MSKQKTNGGDKTASTPSQEDEADIVKEVGAEPANDGSGDMLVDEAKIREMGAVDAESIRDNRRVKAIVNKKRAGVKDVQFNMDSVLEKYEGLTKYWPSNTIDVNVKRVSGGPPVTWVIQSRPKTGAELYAAILAQHGRCDSAEYEVRFIDYTSKEKRGTGRITMPDTRDTPPSLQPPQGQQPLMNPYGQQPPQAPPAAPTTDPVAMMGKMFEIFRQMQPAPTVPQPTPAPVSASFPGQSADPVAMMGKMFEIFRQVQPAQPTPQPQPVQPSTDPMAVMQETFRLFQQVQTPAAQPVMPPPPPQGSDPSVVMEWMQKMLPIFQKMQQPQPAPQPQVVVQPAPQPAVDPMAMMQTMFGMFQKMQQAVQPPPQQGPYRDPQAGPYRDPNGQYAPPRGPYGGPRPYYSGPQGQPGYPPQGQQPGYPPQPPQRPKTAAEEFRDAIGVVDMAVSIAERFRPQAPAPESYDDRNDDDNPVKVVDVGGVQVLVNKADGAARKWETGVALIPTLLKWAAEQREAIMKAQSEREAKQQRRQQPLPPGYVEVGPGYQPPPGFVAVPVEMGQGLPPPPDEMPPPITQQEERPRPQRTWGAPPMPGDGG